jgi:hypothetical protein
LIDADRFDVEGHRMSTFCYQAVSGSGRPSGFASPSVRRAAGGVAGHPRADTSQRSNPETIVRRGRVRDRTSGLHRAILPADHFDGVIKP